ncbi:unnamed protein product [Protopolystoma xenopodis]|uniref:RRM domain-containing protein n=1 Tax=Protopolystoma xenopodis TaxID=117903 RepID=A0A448XBY0_9PLAT|nr:unnamed protein product [Protopolystoma xenopodis]
MASVEEVDPELEEEVQEECSNYGEVLRLLLHLTPQQEVRIFVHFDAIEAVKAACLALNGRFFGGRVVRARPYDNELFQLKQLDED